MEQQSIQEGVGVSLLTDYTLKMLECEWSLADPKEAFSAAQDWAVIGFQYYTRRQPSKSERGVILRAGLAALHLYLRQRADDLGLLYTFGYAVPGADAVIEQLAALDVLITDIRYMARSRAAKWRKAALQGRLGTSYLRLRALGNVNYRQPGNIQIFQPETGVRLASDRLRQGQHVALMCQCPQLDGCHRAAAADLLIARLPALKVVHL